MGRERGGGKGLRWQILYVLCPVEQCSVLDSLGDAMGKERVLCSFPVCAMVQRRSLHVFSPLLFNSV